MFKQSFILLIWLCAAFSVAHGEHAVSHGGMVSGGGGAYLCSSGQALLVDLWEAENTLWNWPHGDKVLEFSRQDGSAEDIAIHAIEKLRALDPALYETVKERLNFVLNQNYWNLLPSSISLMPPADLAVDYYPTGCPPVGMIRFNGATNQLDIKYDIFESLKNSLHQAATFTHEALYIALKNYDSIQYATSEKVRRLNACLYSETACFSSLLPLQTWLDKNSGNVIQCQYKSGSGQQSLTFYTTSKSFGHPIVLGAVNDNPFVYTYKASAAHHTSYLKYNFDTYLREYDFKPFLGELLVQPYGNRLEMNIATPLEFIGGERFSSFHTTSIPCEKIP